MTLLTNLLLTKGLPVFLPTAVAHLAAYDDGAPHFVRYWPRPADASFYPLPRLSTLTTERFPFMDHPHISSAEDDARLAALGVTSDFDRSMSMLENFALGFTYLSPVVGVYTLFDASLHTGGSPMIWSYVIAGIGQFLVALVFGEVVSQFPISGGIYPWSRRLVGRKWSWVTAWVYVWALFSTIAAVATGAAPFLALLTGAPSTPLITTAIALGLIIFSTACNLVGTKLLARVAMFGFVCELVGALFVGGYLLAFHRVNSLASLLDPMNGQLSTCFSGGFSSRPVLLLWF